jgi:hypothetical protein
MGTPELIVEKRYLSRSKAWVARPSGRIGAIRRPK